MILQENFEVLITNRNYKFYKEKGYDVKKGEICLIKNKDYPPKREDIEKRQCDNCGKIIERKRSLHSSTFKNFGEDLCQECAKSKRIEKSKKTNLSKYGVEFPMQSEDIKQKARSTTLKNYGVEYSFQNPNVQEKATKGFNDKKNNNNNFLIELNKKRIETNLKKYGVENVFQSEEIKEKSKKTNLEKYGVEFITQSEEIREIIRKTCLERFGVEHPLQNPEIMQKFINTMYDKGTIATSKPQKEIYNLCKKMYPNWEINLNFPLQKFSLDIAIKTNENCLIDIEYDGWFWHKDKRKDYSRDVIVKKYGYKILRIRSGELIPSEEQIKDSINCLLLNSNTFKEIILSDWEKRQKNKNKNKNKNST